MTDGPRLDLHVHSRHSPDSRLTLDALASRLPFVELRGFAVTDHNSVRSHEELPELRKRFPGYVFLPGVEVSTADGHLLVYGVSERPPPHRPIAETIDWALARGGVPVLAHPFRWGHGVGRRVATAVRGSGIEVRNGHTSLLANMKAELLAAQRNLVATGGSDVHELRDLGRAFTEFPAEARSTDDLLEALRHGRVTGDGSSLAFAGRLRLGVRTSVLRLGRGLRPI